MLALSIGSALAQNRDFVSPETATVTIFEVNGHSAFLLTPKSPLSRDDSPWLWFAPTLFQKDPPNKLKKNLPDASNKYVFDELLRRGVHVAGVDVEESYGSPDGVKIYTAFYKLVVEKFHLSKQPCLLAQSRGGLMLYNWAAEHADSVRCIAGIYPVTDLRTWPLPTDSRPQFLEARDAYGFNDDAQFTKHLEEFSPVSHVASLAGQRVPVLHLHGGSDRWVPLSANSCEFARLYRVLGGDAKVEVMRGKDHESADEFFKSCDLLTFLFSHLCNPSPLPISCLKVDFGSCP